MNNIQKKRDISIIAIGLYLILLGFFNFPFMVMEISLARTIVIFNLIKDHGYPPSLFPENMPFHLKFMVSVFLTYLKHILWTVGILLGGILILSRKSWCRLFVIFSCILLIFIHFYFIVEYIINTESIMKYADTLYTIRGTYTDVVYPYIGMILAFLFPLYYLSRPRIKILFNK